jgi:membrane protein
MKARFQAILLTLLLLLTMSLCLASMFAGDFAAAWLHHHMQTRLLTGTTVAVARVLGWAIAVIIVGLSFNLTYYCAPDLRVRQWRWTSPGTTLAVTGWLLASLGFRLDLHYFNSYSVTYGSLGAFIILLMWFYISGLMLLLGAEFNSELEAAAMEAKLRNETQPTPISTEILRPVV